MELDPLRRTERRLIRRSPLRGRAAVSHLTNYFGSDVFSVVFVRLLREGLPSGPRHRGGCVHGGRRAADAGVRLMGGQDDAAGYAHQLAHELKTIGADPPAGFPELFLFHARRVGTGTHADLGALLVIECLEAKPSGRVLDAVEVGRALDRVRHRPIREAVGWRRRFRQLADSDVVDRRESMVGQRVDDLDTIRLVLSELTPRESLALELFAEGRASEEIGTSLGVSATAVRQWLSRARKRLRQRFPEGPPSG
jgi:RNA polymerase sigma factor (sigma-70 family)